jgi:hypothetical protein
MSENGLKTLSDAAKELGVHRNTVGDLVRTLGIRTRPMSNGKAKGLDERGMLQLRKVLRMAPARASA